MKQFTDDVVRRIAEDLMNKNGSTTNLDIKMALRANGFWAMQVDVANAMNRVVPNQYIWQTSNNGRFNTYTINASSCIGYQAGNVIPISSYAPTKRKKYTRVDISNITFFDVSYTPGLANTALDNNDWVVYFPSLQKAYVIDGKPTLTRDQARCMGRKYMGIADISDVLACRVQRWVGF